MLYTTLQYIEISTIMTTNAKHTRTRHLVAMSCTKLLDTFTPILLFPYGQNSLVSTVYENILLALGPSNFTEINSLN